MKRLDFDDKKPSILKIRYGNNPTSSAMIWFIEYIFSSLIYFLILSAINFFTMFIIKRIKNSFNSQKSFSQYVAFYFSSMYWSVQWRLLF
jgi:hypothetical protein